MSERKYSIQPANSASLHEIQTANRRRLLQAAEAREITPAELRVGDRFVKNGSFYDVHDIADGFVSCIIEPMSANGEHSFPGIMKFRIEDFLAGMRGAKVKSWRERIV